MISLPDANVLLALAWKQHVHHERAHHWFQSAASDGWATCVLTEAAFLRLSLNPQVVGVTINGATALHVLRGMTSHPQHTFIANYPSLTDQSFDELASVIRGYRQVTDGVLLYLVHFMGMKLVTFDQPIRALNPWPESLQVL